MRKLEWKRDGHASGRFAWAAISSPANCPAASLGNAAAAIIAALSVESPGEGKCTGYGNRADWAAARNPVLQATPPETIKERAPMRSAEAAARVSSSVITACWNEAKRSRVRW